MSGIESRYQEFLRISVSHNGAKDTRKGEKSEYQQIEKFCLGARWIPGQNRKVLTRLSDFSRNDMLREGFRSAEYRKIYGQVLICLFSPFVR